MSDEAYKACIAALDDVTAAFNSGRAELSSAPTRYEADFAAFRLMQLVWLHVNSISHISTIPCTGSHLASAWVLARSAFETAVTALWLVIEDDWKEREARWLGWVTSEEEYWAKLATEFERIAPASVEPCIAKVHRLKDRREAITKLLPKDSRLRRPKMPQMIKEVGLEQRYYIPYRVTSHVAHGGAGADEWAVRCEGNRIFLGNVEAISSWKDLFRMASWSVVRPGVIVLTRSGASSDACDKLLSSHKRLLEVTERLDEQI